MANKDISEIIKKVRKCIKPTPTWSYVYSEIQTQPDFVSAENLAKRICNNDENFHYLNKEDLTKSQVKRLQKEVLEFLENPPSYKVIKQVVRSEPEDYSPERLAKIIGKRYPKYASANNRKDKSKKSSAKKKKRKKKKRKKKKCAQSTKKVYVTIYGNPGNYWVVAWKGWRRSFVVNPRNLYSGIPKKYMNKKDAYKDCQRSEYQIMSNEAFFAKAPKVPENIMWALKRKNQRRRGACLYKDTRLVAHVADMLPKDDKGNRKIAKVYLRDIENLFHQAREMPNVAILKAIRLSKRGGLTARKTVKKLREMKYGYKGKPQHMKVIYTPM